MQVVDRKLSESTAGDAQKPVESVHAWAVEMLDFER